MTVQTITSAYGPMAGQTLTIERGGKLTLNGRAYRVLTINGAPAPTETWVLGRHLSLTA